MKAAGKKDKEGYKTIKVKESAYDDLKRMGVGIGAAVDILVKSQRKQIEKKIEDIKGMSDEVAQLMLQHGIFDVKFSGAGITEVFEEGNIVHIKGYANIDIPDPEARASLIEILKSKEEVQ